MMLRGSPKKLLSRIASLALSAVMVLSAVPPFEVSAVSNAVSFERFDSLPFTYSGSSSIDINHESYLTDGVFEVTDTKNQYYRSIWAEQVWGYSDGYTIKVNTTQPKLISVATENITLELCDGANVYVSVGVNYNYNVSPVTWNTYSDTLKVKAGKNVLLDLNLGLPTGAGYASSPEGGAPTLNVEYDDNIYIHCSDTVYALIQDKPELENAVFSLTFNNNTSSVNRPDFKIPGVDYSLVAEENQPFTPNKVTDQYFYFAEQPTLELKHPVQFKDTVLQREISLKDNYIEFINCGFGNLTASSSSHSYSDGNRSAWHTQRATSYQTQYNSAPLALTLNSCSITLEDCTAKFEGCVFTQPSIDFTAEVVRYCYDSPSTGSAIKLTSREIVQSGIRFSLDSDVNIKGNSDIDFINCTFNSGSPAYISDDATTATGSILTYAQPTQIQAAVDNTILNNSAQWGTQLVTLKSFIVGYSSDNYYNDSCSYYLCVKDVTQNAFHLDLTISDTAKVNFTNCSFADMNASWFGVEDVIRTYPGRQYQDYFITIYDSDGHATSTQPTFSTWGKNGVSTNFSTFYTCIGAATGSPSADIYIGDNAIVNFTSCRFANCDATNYKSLRVASSTTDSNYNVTYRLQSFPVIYTVTNNTLYASIFDINNQLRNLQSLTCNLNLSGNAVVSLNGCRAGSANLPIGSTHFNLITGGNSTCEVKNSTFHLTNDMSQNFPVSCAYNASSRDYVYTYVTQRDGTSNLNFSSSVLPTLQNNSFHYSTKRNSCTSVSTPEYHPSVLMDNSIRGVLRYTTHGDVEIPETISLAQSNAKLYLTTDGDISIKNSKDSGGTAGLLSLTGNDISIENSSVFGTLDLHNTGDTKLQDVTVKGKVNYHNTASTPVNTITNCFIDGGLSVNSGVEQEFNVKGVTSNAVANFADTKLLLDGGNYSGSPALITTLGRVKRGTFVDAANTASNIVPHEDSEITSKETNAQGITTTVVKLSNPPIIIDWEDFPGIELDVDLAPPVIEVIRDPADARNPTTQVTLTVNAMDPNGNDDPKPISINGGPFVESGATYTVTENQVVTIAARDANGNVRDYQVNISNIDAGKPEIVGFKQSNNDWTKDPVRVYVEAVDDVKLAPAPYRFTFVPNSTGTAVVGEWQSDRSYQVTENGRLVVEVKDMLGNIATSDPYEVRNIDKIAPAGVVSSNPPAGTQAGPKDGVLVMVNVTNTGDPVTGDASPLATTLVRWDSAEGWSSDTERKVYSNQTLNIQVRDSLGNVTTLPPYTVSNISTDAPIITSLTSDRGARTHQQSPVVITVQAVGGGTTPLHARPYSWDGGNTWTTSNKFHVTKNGEYFVKVRDSVGTEVEASILIDWIDDTPPNVYMFLYKGIADDDPDEMVWRLKVEASDMPSGVEFIETLWDGQIHTTSPVTFQVMEPGSYGVKVTDKAGNITFVEKLVTAESVGLDSGGFGGSDATVNITLPEEGTSDPAFGTNISNLVYSPVKVYNRDTGTAMDYPSTPGIDINIVASAKRRTWLSGVATFNGKEYPVVFDGGTADGVEGDDGIPGTIHIPITDITHDVRNGRIVVLLKEHKDSSKTELRREGSITLYTSVQVTDPKVNYTYNRTTGELSVVSTSTVAGIKNTSYIVNGGSPETYTGAFVVPSGPGTVKIVATDNCGQTTTINLDIEDLPLTGQGGGNLPTVELPVGTEINSYYIASSNAEVYIIGGTRTNTSNIPSNEVFDNIVN